MKSFLQFFSQSATFIKRQQRDWKVTVIRTSLDRLAYQTAYPYLSIYIVALGATATQLGLINSIGMIVAGIFAPLIGWFIDRIGPKNIYLLGIGMLAVSYLTYAIAQSWVIAVFAMAAYWLGYSTSIQSCATVCGNCLANEDRATGMTICETLASGLLGMAGPMIGAWMVTSFGGANATGIRPIFYFCLLISLGTLIVVWTQLSTRRWKVSNVVKPNMLKDIFQVLKEGKNLKRWLIIASIAQLPLAMVFPFAPLYAYEIRGATPFVLGAMVTGSALISIIFAIPLGRLADRIGRKKIIYAMTPLFWASNLLLVWSPTPALLITAGILQGFYYISSPITAAMERELVPPEQMGRWIGIARSCRLMLNAGFAFLCGIVWDKVGPQYVFLAFVVIDLAVRIPLLVTMPETLGMRFRQQPSQELTTGK